MNTVRKKNMPKMAAPTHSMIRFAPVRSRSRSSRSGSSGCRLRASITANAASSSTDAASATTTFASPQCETPSAVVAALTSP
jgi:hypothetical protein